MAVEKIRNKKGNIGKGNEKRKWKMLKRLKL